ncbi:MAG: PQQ-binding-like beta-propeller repeat protein [Gammaproteobacteria bacterium]|nr:PQQ-binding-like beta-propeller repeat protein [Gammaproteobacteria bacterium]
MKLKSMLILGVKGHVVCLRKEDGREVWRTHLRGRGNTTVLRDGDRVFAATKGYLYALDIQSGSILWVNGLPKLGFGTCIMGSPNQGVMAAINIIVQQQMAAAAAASAAAGASAAAASS